LGWADLRRAPGISLVYGLAIAAAGYVITYLSWKVPLLVITFLGGFLLVAPVIAVGLYEVSRRLEQGERPTLAHALAAWRRNRWSLLFMGALLGILLVAWGRVTGVIAALSFPALGPDGHLVTWSTLLSADGVGFFALFALLGALLAVGVFTVTAVSIPMLLDRPVDAVTAAATSVRAVARNWPVMVLWAGLIVALTGIGLVTLYLGLVVTMPLVAYATWHAYRQVVAS
jgi:uncharacterized membrane protein